MNKVTNLRLSDIILEDCLESPSGRHHFLLPPTGGGPIMQGVCKHCGAKREHNNYGNNVFDQINRGFPRKRPVPRTPQPEKVQRYIGVRDDVGD